MERTVIYRVVRALIVYLDFSEFHYHNYIGLVLSRRIVVSARSLSNACARESRAVSVR